MNIDFKTQVNFLSNLFDSFWLQDDLKAKECFDNISNQILIWKHTKKVKSKNLYWLIIDTQDSPEEIKDFVTDIVFDCTSVSEPDRMEMFLRWKEIRTNL